MEYLPDILLWAYIFAVFAIIWYVVASLVDGLYVILQRNNLKRLLRTLGKLGMAWFFAWVIVRIGMSTMVLP